MDFGSYIGQLLSGEHREDLETAETTQTAPPDTAIPLPSPVQTDGCRFGGVSGLRFGLPTIQGEEMGPK